MSCKSTLVYAADDFHLYTDAQDDSGVWLELVDPVFDASAVPCERGRRTTVTVKIPTAVWETIRQVRTNYFPAAGKTDDELRVMAAEHLRLLQDVFSRGFAIDRVEEYFEDLKRARAEQEAVLVRMDEYRRLNPGLALYDEKGEADE